MTRRAHRFCISLSSCWLLVAAGCAHTNASSRETSAHVVATSSSQTVRGDGFAYDIPASLRVERDGEAFVHHSSDGANLTITLVELPYDLDLEGEAQDTLARLEERGARVHYDGLFERGDMIAALGQAILDEYRRNLLVVVVRAAGHAFLLECSDAFESAETMADTCMDVASSLRATR